MKSYKKYKPSGIEWIGDIPEHWEVKRLKYIANVQSSNVDKKSYDNEENILLCNYMDVYKNEIIDDSLAFMKATATNVEIGKFILKEGDVLITKDSETPDDIANPAFVTKNFEDVICGYHLAQISSDKISLSGKYLFRLFQSDKYKAQFIVGANGVTRYGLSISTFTNAVVPLPTLPEQQSIANFLDNKTSLIDEAISQKQQLIELLKEERTALINHAVTKGINPDVKLKPIGIEWLGDIPEHWEVKKLKYVAIIKYGLGQPPKQKIGGLPLIRATNVERGRIVEKDLLFVDPEDIPFDRDPILRENDIIVVRSGAYTADSAIIPKKYDGAITGYDMVVRPVKINPKFIGYGLLSNYILDLQLLPLTHRAAQPHLNREELGETIFVIPPINEQNKVVDHIETESQKINNAISKIEHEITLLQEYRTSLINETVTGKICVV